MTPFSQARRAKSSALEATPYQQAGQVWDDRTGLALAHARNWRRMHVANVTDTYVWNVVGSNSYGLSDRRRITATLSVDF